MDSIVVRVEGGVAVVEVPRERRSEVAAVLLGLVEDRSEVRTVTQAPGGLGFRLPARYASEVHGALVASPEAVGVDEGVSPEPVEEPVEEVVPEAVGDSAVVPARNATRGAWATFLDSVGVAYPEDSGRNDLVDIWDGLNAVSDD